MFVQVDHTLCYDYDRPVFLEPTTLRLTPRQDACQRLLTHSLVVEPSPQGETWSIEPDGSDARIVWFAGRQQSLRIHTRSLVQTLRDNPFDALVTDPSATTVPAAYPAHVAEVLGPWQGGPVDPAVSTWAHDLAQAAGNQTLAFLSELTSWIHGNCHMIVRDDGAPWSPTHTLADRTGSCRDVAMLWIAACRAHGLAARFVSGYSLHHPPNTTEHELHAWAEVYLPGAGWRGYDPSLGLATADGHIALATGPDHRLAAPMTGSFRGTGASATMTYNIAMRSGDAPDNLAE